MVAKYSAIPKINLTQVFPNTPDLPYSYIEFMEHISNYMKELPTLRQGQAMEIIMSYIAPKFSDSLLGHLTYDPFYDNKKIKDFIIKCFECGILK